MTQISVTTQCENCKNRFKTLGTPRCRAYPDIIPIQLYEQLVSHKKPFPGDNGIMFEPTEEPVVVGEES